MIIETKTISDSPAFIATEQIACILFVGAARWRICLTSGDSLYVSEEAGQAIVKHWSTEQAVRKVTP